MSTIISIGNSQGIILPKNVLKNLDLHIKDKLNLEVRGDEIILKKVEPKLKAKDIRKNWVTQINSIGKNTFEDLDISEWEWEE